MTCEPLVTTASVTAVVAAVVGLVVAFGVPLTDDQQKAILAATAVLAPMLVGFISRARVTTPNGSVVALRDPKTRAGGRR